MVVPGACGTGTAPMNNIFRFAFTPGDTLTGTFCAEGSNILVTAWPINAANANIFRCWRFASNAIACQQIF
jgi:hypothetical protein